MSDEGWRQAEQFTWTRHRTGLREAGRWPSSTGSQRMAERAAAHRRRRPRAARPADGCRPLPPRGARRVDADAGMRRIASRLSPRRPACPMLARLLRAVGVARGPGRARRHRVGADAPPARPRAGSVDVLLRAGYTAPLWLPCPFVVAIYDVSFFAHPEWFGWREGLRRRWLTRAAAERAASVVTISEFSAAEIVALPPRRRASGFVSPRRARRRRRRAAIRPARSRLVLYVGSLFNRRHIPELIRRLCAGTARRCRTRGSCSSATTARRRAIDPTALAADSASAIGRVDWRDMSDDAELDRPVRGRARVRVPVGLRRLRDDAARSDGARRAVGAARHAGRARGLRRRRAARAAGLRGDRRGPASRFSTDDARPRRRSWLRGQARLRALSWARTAATILRALEAGGRHDGDERPRHHHRQLQHPRGSRRVPRVAARRSRPRAAARSSSSTTRRPTAASTAVGERWPRCTARSRSSATSASAPPTTSALRAVGRAARRCCSTATRSCRPARIDTLVDRLVATGAVAAGPRLSTATGGRKCRSARCCRRGPSSSSDCASAWPARARRVGAPLHRRPRRATSGGGLGQRRLPARPPRGRARRRPLRRALLHVRGRRRLLRRASRGAAAGFCSRRRRRSSTSAADRVARAGRQPIRRTTTAATSRSTKSTPCAGRRGSGSGCGCAAAPVR